MLSKSAARTFFVAGTVLCGAAFAALTIDTHRQLPERTHAEDITDAVARGHEIWTDKNCMGCHTLLGEGAYYAPELTQVLARRGAPWIRVFLKDPEAMFPGRRRMVKYDFTDAQIDDLLAFFTWIGRIDANGFPAPPPYAPKAAPVVTSGRAMANAPPVFQQICSACHQIGGVGGKVGPALDDVSARLDDASLDRWLRDPAAVKPGTAMPKLPLTDDDRAALVRFLLH